MYLFLYLEFFNVLSNINAKIPMNSNDNNDDSFENNNNNHYYYHYYMKFEIRTINLEILWWSFKIMNISSEIFNFDCFSLKNI